MRWSALLISIVTGLLVFLCFLIFNLNDAVVSLDLLFSEIDASLGAIIIVSFIVGLLTSIILEIIYFISKRNSKDE
jgi:uncharacterized integral membrane protein